MKRTVVIGDVHGCFEELKALLRACAIQESDRIVFTGDLIGKGPRSRKVVKWARRRGADAVRGNHDEHGLRWWRAVNRGETPPPVRPQHLKCIESLKPKDWRWLEARPLWLELPEYDAIVVHGGLVRGRPLSEQPPELLMNMRSESPEGVPSRQLDAGVPWASRWTGPRHVYFGHDAVRGLQEYPFATGLDTGCVYGGSLTACILPERRLVSVPAAQVWATPKGGRR